METQKQTAERHQVPPYPLRLPPELTAQLKARASANRRSLNSELTVRLENSVKIEEVSEQGAAQ